MITATLDTHVWIWLLSGDRKLGRAARRLLGESKSSFGLSPISIWELGLLAERKRIELSPSPSEWIDTALEHFPLTEVSFSFEVVRSLEHLSFTHADPADRFIAASTHLLGVPLLTADDRLIALPWLETIDARK